MTSIASTGASTTSRFACSSSKASVLKSGATALLSIAALLLSATSAQAQNGSRSWTGAIDSDFYNGANWDAAGDFPNGNITYAGSPVNSTINRNSGNTYSYTYGTFFNNTLGTQSSFTFPAPGTDYIIAASLITKDVTSGSLTNEFGVNVVLVSGAKTITTGSNHHVHISGSLAGGSAWTKEGAGTLILSGASTYTSSTTVNAGKLQLGNGGAGGSLATTSAITVASGATFSINQSDTVTQGTDFSAAAIAGSGTFDVKGGATVVLTNTASFDDGVSVSVASDSFLNLDFTGTDVVAGIDLGAGPVTGEWGAIGSGASNESARITGTGTLGVPQDITWDASDDSDWTGPSDATSWSTATFFDGDNVSFGATGAGTVTIIGAVQTSGVTVDSASDYTFTGDAIGGTGTLTKSGAGKLTLASANTYTGVTTISGGQLRISHNDALGTTTGGTIIGTLTKLELEGDLTIAEPIINQGGGGGKIQSVSGTQTFTGLITLEGSIDIRGNDYIFQGGITSANNSGLGINGVRYIVDTNPISLGAGTFGLTSAGNNPANTSQLNVAGNVWGLMRLNFGGYLTLGGDNYMPADAGVEFGWNSVGASSGTLDLNGFDQTVAFLRQAANFPTVNGDQNITGGGTLTIDTPAGTYDYHGRFTDGATATSIVKSGDSTQILNNQSGTASNFSGSLTVNAGILRSESGSDFSDFCTVVVNDGTLDLNYVGTDQIAGLDLGAGFVASGVYTSADSAFITGTGSLTVVALPLVWDGSTDSDWTNPDSDSWSGYTYNNGQAAIFADAGAGTVTLSGAIAPFAVTVGGASDYTFAGAALGGTDTTLTKNDAGTLTLSVANTYTGATTVNGGVLAISDGTSLGTTAAGTTVTIGAQLAIDGGITVAEPLTIAGSGQSNNGGLKTVGVANNTISGAIDVTAARIRADGSSPLTLTGGITGDTLILTGAVTVSTTPIVLSGTLNIAGDDVATSYNANGGTDVAFNLGNVTQLNVAGNSAATTNLFFDAQVQLGVDDALATTTNLSFLSYGADISTYTTKFDLGGYSQTVASLSSTQNPSSLVPQGVNMSITSTGGTGTGTLTVDQATDTTYSGRFDGTMNLVKAGVGTLTLDNRSSAAHSISGTTTVSAGILDIDTDYTSAITVAATGSLEVDLGTTLTLQGALSVDAASEIVIDGTPTLDSYTLISAASITGSPVLSATITNYVLEVIGNELQLNFNPAVWSGSGNSVWADGDATNWSFTYNNGAPVSFTDTGAGTVTVSTALTPLSVLVDSTADYTFTGAGSITAPFTKQGAGNLTIDTTLNSSAAITFNGGTTTITGAVESSISGGGNMTQGDGAMIIDGGTFSMITDGAVQTGLYMDNDITLRNGGTITSNARFGMVTGTTLVIEGGSGAAVTAANSIQLSPSAATYRYEFDATGVAYLQAGSYAALDGASFEVDLTNFAGWGSAATFPLVNTGNVAGVPAGASSPVEAPAGFTITAPGKTYGVDYTINVSTTTNVCEVAILEVATNDVASWAATFTASDAAFTGSPATDPLTDYDNDGLSNLLEYVLGGSPIANQDTAVPTVSQDATYMIFTYNRSDISTATGNDVTIVAEYAADLSGSWTAAVNGTASVVIEENTSADPDVVTVKVPLAGTEQFIRLNVVTTGP